jgi:hypothetical protein
MVSGQEPKAEKEPVRLVSTRAFYSGGNMIGGSHPTAASWPFTVPKGKNRLLLVLTTAKADPTLIGKKSAKGRNMSQRAMISSLKYGGKDLICTKQFNELNYDDNHVVFWYMKNPPVGTANIDAIQFRKDNGGELWATAFVLTGVDQKNPLQEILRFHADQGKPQTIKSKYGGLVIAEARIVKLSYADPSQTVQYANDKSRLGTTALGAPEVKLSWTWEKKFKRISDGKYRGVSGKAKVVAISVNPHNSFTKAPTVEKDKFFAEPLNLKKKTEPGLSVTLYDLTGNPAKGGARGFNYKKAVTGNTIPAGFEKQKIAAKKIVPNIDYKYDFAHHKGLKYDKGFMDSGIRDNFAADYKGFITLPETGRYVFELNSNDQSMLYINDKLVINNRGHNQFTMKMAPVNLKKGTYRIRVLYVEEKWKDASKRSSHGIKLGWRPPSGYPKDMPIQQWKLEKGVNPIPATAFSHEAP